MPIARKYRAVVARPKRPTLAGLILEHIAEAGEALLDSFFPRKYPQARLWRKLLGLDATYEFKRATFASILSQFQAQGLVERRVKTGQSFWRVTHRGRAAVGVRPPARQPNADGQKRIVCFDIPERDRAKRQWLRGELIALGYQPLQRSVWIGESPLPVEFIEALDTLKLYDCVRILRVESKGTLRSRHARS